jgi:hypothetical protein
MQFEHGWQSEPNPKKTILQLKLEMVTFFNYMPKEIAYPKVNFVIK